MSPAKKTTKRGAQPIARRGAARKRTTKPAKQPAAKRATKRTARNRPARPAPRRATKRAAPQRKSALRVVRRAAPKAAPKATAFPQRAGASSKQRALFELMRARAALVAAIQGLSGGSAGEPIAPGKWSVRETVLHVGHWEREVVRALEAALRGRAPEWMAWDAAQDAHASREAIVSLGHHDWDGAVRLLQTIRSELLESIESVPDEPAAVWAREHPFGNLVQHSIWHDRHHAEIIKRWRTRGRG